MKQIGEDPKLPQALVQGCLDLGARLQNRRVAVGDGGDLHQPERAGDEMLSG